MKRVIEIQKLYHEQQLSQEHIGQIYGITRQRVSQLLAKYPYKKGHIPVQYRSSTYRPRIRSYRITELGEVIKSNLHHSISTETARGMTGRDYAREIVRTRDNWTCQNCSKVWVKGTRRLDVHHLNGYCGKKSKKADSVKEISGLITLCHKCHYNHHQFSKRLTGEWT